jgi:hypothetical protein
MEEILTATNERVRPKIPEVELWLAVIGQAIEDLSNPDLCEAAAVWFTSPSEEPATFLWICEHLDISASAVRSALIKRAIREIPAISFASVPMARAG